MNKKIPLSRVPDHLEHLANELIRETVITMDRKIKMKSPVDSGRLRMSWQVGENNSPGGQGIGPVAKGLVAPVDRINYTRERIGNNYNIHSNLPYAEPVCMGVNLPPSWGGRYRSRNGLGPNWFRLIAKEEGNRVRRNWETVLRRN